MGQKMLTFPCKNTVTINGKCTNQPPSKCTLLVGRNKCLYQSFIKFRTNSLQESLNILSVILKVYLFRNFYPKTPKTISVHQVLSSCHAGKELKINSFPIASASISKENNRFICFDITPLFVDWYMGNSANKGLLLKLPNEIYPSLLGFRSKDFCDSQFWPVLEVAYLEPHPPGKSCCQTLDVNTSVITNNNMQTTAALNVQQFNYTYYIINTGASSATVSLQLSPDGTNWLTDQPLQAIAPGGILPFVPNLIATYARLTYQTTVSDHSTSLDIRIRGFSS